MDWWIGGIVLLLAAVYIISPLVICRYSLRHDNPDEISPALQQIIRRFEWRASSRQSGSHAMLVLILGLLAAAAWVFVEAKAITTRETSGDLSQKLSQAKTKLDTDVSEQNRAKDELNAAVDPIIKMIGRALESGGTAMTLELLDGTNKIKDTSMIATEVQNHGPTGTASINIRIFVSGHRTNSSSGLLEPYQILYFDRTLTSDDLTNWLMGKTSGSRKICRLS